MKTKLIVSIVALAIAMGAQAQYTVMKTNGIPATVNNTQKDVITGSDSEGWKVGGVAIASVKYLKVKTLAERKTAYKAPSHADHYVSIAGWESRASWNLANIHDPSVMLAEDGYYYMYTTDASYGNAHTGHGHFMCRRSKNLVNWTFMGTTMPSLPSWIEGKLNEIRAAMGLSASTADFTDDTQFGFWAPCARKVRDGLYRMYYSITIPGTIDGDGTWSERCFIGLMETATPWDVDSWEDKGYVLTNASDKQLNYNVAADNWGNCYFKWNAIDPSFIITPDDEHWLVYGSWHSGFAAVELNPETGKPLAELGNPWGSDISAYGKLVYTRQKNNRWQGSEGPEVVYHDGYYYLFMAYDELSVAYNTRVVRSKNIDGPYYSINGTNVTANGGNALPIVTHPYKFADDPGWVGISHCAVFDDGQGNWYYASQGRLPEGAYDNAYANANMLGHIRRIVWTDSGWPLVMPERYGAVPQTPITEDELVGTWENITLTYSAGNQKESVSITLNEDNTVTGAPFNGSTWSLNAEKNILTIGTRKLHLARETDWERSPRKATIVYAGIVGTSTYWGKKNQ